MKRPISIGTFGVVYLMLAAVILTTLMAGFATHPGVVLGIMTLLSALVMVHRLRSSRGPSFHVHLALLVLTVLVGLLVISFGSDRTELWFATCYGLFNVLYLLELMFLARAYR
ncbi:hypothetical protein [Alicyclobacillus hesperidum]|uniref:Uncharacterized protein n=2 Tax=Alicyclobacillus hesperidum TaxID=89784 RepID=A0A1H2QQ63_9BACL|nr:hypothetical protein [Alicyclobacillus hesperidum]SDW09271.1 hypothetical protein SAMN04489725_1022 [Alicyclobacillus hesperidum]